MADARRRARDEPLRLHRNWVAPAVVFVLWTGAALVVAHFAFRVRGRPAGLCLAQRDPFF